MAKVFLTRALQAIEIMDCSDGVHNKMSKTQKYYIERKSLLAPFENQSKYQFYFSDQSKRVILING